MREFKKYIIINNFDVIISTNDLNFAHNFIKEHINPNLIKLYVCIDYLEK